MEQSTLGKLMWERRLFEMNGNDAAVERLDKIIAKLTKDKEEAEKQKKKAGF